jgi:hypothetical protein
MEEVMKRIMEVLAIVAMLGLGLSINAKCEEPVELKGTTGSVQLKNNWVVKDKGDGFFFQTLAMFLQTPTPVGIGGDFTYQPKGDYVEYAPYLTLNRGPHYALLGMSTNNLKGNFVQAGYWHIGTYAKFNLVADLRAYVGTNANSKSFLDNYFEANYPVTSSVNLGLVADDNFSLEGRGNKIFVGPIGYWKVAKSVTLFGRYLHGWSDYAGVKSQSEMFRAGINYSF